MKTATYTVKNALGIHARPAADIARFVGKHKSEVTLTNGAKKANGKSVLITALGAKKGAEVTVTVSGEDEEEVFTQLDDMFTHGFYEE